MAKVKTAAQMEKMADDVSAALDRMWDAGHQSDVSLVRAFMRANAEYHRQQLKMSSDIAAELERQLRERNRRIVIPLPRPDTGGE